MKTTKESTMTENDLNVILLRLKYLEDTGMDTVRRLQSLDANVESLEAKITNKLLHAIGISKHQGISQEQILSRNRNSVGLLTNKFLDSETILMKEDEKREFGKKIVERISSNAINIHHQDTESPNTRRSWIYYILCGAVYISCFIISAYYITAAYNKWQASPVVTAASNNHFELQDVPFPAITICWPDKYKSDYSYDQNKKDCLDCHNHVCKFKNETCGKAELMTLVLANLICLRDDLPEWLWVDGLVQKRIDNNEFNMYMNKLLPPCEADGGINFVEDNDKPLPINRCDHRFQQSFSVTPDRACITFNSLRHTDIYEHRVVTALPLFYQSQRNVSGNPIWSYDNMFRGFKGSEQSVPIYGHKSVHFYVRTQEEEFDKLCKHSNHSIVSLMVHSPNEMPYGQEFATKIPLHENTVLMVDFEPKITLAQEDLAQYTPQQRGCFFSYENKLSMFKFYTQANCEIECEVNTYIDKHGCVPLYYPRPNSSVKVCTQSVSLPVRYCGCLPDCNLIRYKVKTQEQPKWWNSTGVSSLVIAVGFFESSIFYTDTRYSINSLGEFLAFSLGILGGFLGVSVTCVWHLLYSQAEKLPTSVKTWWKEKI